ncbi:SDR family oxidoreductase [Paracoccus laeviglucosivorans]|uniref:NAD(P)-dependent dehydrogenase, short-chain alcohol dehydrogenase family n=1 Tax=Paracoccus laeviglucosivorans TaxID=1197861 RepID=A0A521FKV6_9RHOB|nr:SDR family oxidoreductase [Paracoccus laeviglucosivorans]SMO96838.1 NAD(P)-dependent dehydrogenase, short-chain alcohol dehydrogenase family [Paracoccus laeviglucosivorans]
MTALVTGGAQRIGREIALALARQGHDIAIHCGRSVAEAEATAAEIRALGVRAQVFQADLLDLDAVEALVPQVNAAMGALSVLVNNASTFEEDSIHSATRESWDRHINSNLRAPFMLIQQFAAQSAEHANGGEVEASNVINMIDQRVLKPRPDFMTYSLAKAGLWWLTRTSAQALAPHIRVNAIAPGPTLKGSRQSEQDFATQQQATILQRGSSPEEICDAVLYLLRAKSVTGQMICVDGGQHLVWQTPDVMIAE